MANLRNKPLDRRYLSEKDRSDYNQSGAAGRGIAAQKRAKARRGALSWQNKRKERTVTRTPGSGGFTAGFGGLQRQRMVEKGAKVQRSKQLRSEKI